MPRELSLPGRTDFFPSIIEIHRLTSLQRSQPSGSRNQAAALEAEGVTVTTGPLGELMIDFTEYGWFPRILPSDAAQGIEPDDEPDDEEEGEGE